MTTLSLDKLKTSDRVNWEPIAFPGVADGVSDPVKRFCYLRHLEVSVADFISVTAEKYPDVAAVLQRNVEDEDVHFEQLCLLSKHLGLQADDSLQHEANLIVAEWNQSDEPSILKAFVLEQMVFMATLPKLTKETSANVANVASWVLRDEVIHVYCNRTLVSQLGLSPSGNLIKLAIKTLLWIFETESVRSQRRVLDTAKLLLKRGFSAVATTDNHVIPSSINFFEVDRNIAY